MPVRGEDGDGSVVLGHFERQTKKSAFFTREKKGRSPFRKKRKSGGRDRAEKNPGFVALFLSPARLLTFSLVASFFVLLSFLLLSFSFTLRRLFTVFSFLIFCTNPRSVARTEQRAKQKRGKSTPEVKKESKRFLIPSRFGPTFFDFETSKNKLDPVNQQNNVGVLALADVQGQDQAPAAARERGGGAHVRTGFLLCWTKREKRADG